MEMFEPRTELGVIVRGSLSKGLEMKLHPQSPIEELRAGRFVVVEGRQYDFFSMITDIPARLMGLGSDYGIRAGARADLVVTDCEDVDRLNLSVLGAIPAEAALSGGRGARAG